MKKEALRVSTTVPAAPTTLYLAWLNPEQHSEMTGEAAKIDSEVGGKFTALNGYVTGKLVILDLGRRIVMSWRTNDFPREEPDSRAEVHFEALGGSTRLTVLHTDIPEGQSDKYRELWNEKYFGPMRTFFSKYLPDPRKPPPPRPPPPPPEMDEEEEEEEEEEETPKKGKSVKPAPPSKKALTKPTPAPSPAKAAPLKPAPSKPAKAPVKAAPAKAAPAKAKSTPKAAPSKTKAGTKPAAKPAPKKATSKATAKKPAAKKPAAKPSKGKKK